MSLVSKASFDKIMMGYQTLLATGKMGSVPLLGQEVLLDDDDAALILVFPRSSEHGGAVDADEEIVDFEERLRRIFVRERNPHSAGTVEEGAAHNAGETVGANGSSAGVTAREFQTMVRHRVLMLMQQAGVRATSFESIDGDEVYVKITMDREGALMKELAERYVYQMPLKEECYRNMQAVGEAYPGGEYPTNDAQQAVPCFNGFLAQQHHLFGGFREIDEVRIIEMRFDRWLSIPELVKQNIVCGYFPAAKYKDVMELHEKWANLKNTPCLPNDEMSEEIRGYFGEEVAFFFQWFTFYCRWLFWLALAGGACSACKHFLGLDVEHRQYAQIAFAIAVTMWAAAFNRAYRSLSERTKQQWGMHDFDAFAMERPEWRADLEGTKKLALKRAMTKVIAVVFCTVFVGAIFGLELYNKYMKELGHNSHAALLTTALIVVGQTIWGKVAPLLADWENHRTQARWDDALTVFLSTVKIFIALWPFINISFIVNTMAPTCDLTLPSALMKLYKSEDRFPKGPSGFPLNVTNAESWVAPFTYLNNANMTCISGCYPENKLTCVAAPWPVGRLWCKTSCVSDLEKSLTVFFITHAVFTIIFLLIPIFLTRMQVRKEMNSAAEKAIESDREAPPYTFLQYQAKCYSEAPYSLGSWGGSRVEDFLELAIGFALITCFGLLVPEMAVFAFLSHVVEYRLTAYRMTNVTCRPMPAGSEGIGIWQSVFEVISFIAVISNVGLAVFVLLPFREEPTGYKLWTFLLLEHVMFGLQILMLFVVPAIPRDVKSIEDLNQVVRKTAFVVASFAGDGNLGIHDYQQVEIGVDPGLNRGLSAQQAMASRWGPGKMH